MSNATTTNAHDVYRWWPINQKLAVSDGNDTIRGMAGHLFYVKGFSACGQSLIFCRAGWAASVCRSKITSATFGAKIILLDKLNINWRSQ